MADPLIVKEKKKVPPKPQSKQETKKKGPSKPQPAWLFPPDENNPVLNPKAKSHEEVETAIKEREKAVDYMQRRVHGVPDRPAPDPLLLTLIGIFLTDFGFNSTSRLFTNERQARQTLNGWEKALGKKIDKNVPKLEQIFRDWHRDWLVKQGDDTSSSGESGDGESEIDGQKKQDAQINSDQDSDSSSACASSDVEIKDAPPPKKAKKSTKEKKKPSPSPSVSSTSPDSDADDEKESAAPKVKASPKKAIRAVAAQLTVGDMVNKLKRKAQSVSPECAMDNSEDEKPTKVKKIKTGTVVSTPITPAQGVKAAKVKNDGVPSTASISTKGSKPAKVKTETVASTLVIPTKAPKAAKAKTPVLVVPNAASSASSSSPESDTSTSDSDEADNSNPSQGASLPALPIGTSDSSVTINGDSNKSSADASPSSSSSSSATSSSSSDSDSDSDAAAAPSPPLTTTTTTTTTTTKKPDRTATKPLAEAKKHKGAKQTPLAEMSEAADADAYLSNKYQSYDYADRAYKDLSVTRGKGFTKEKNKKKRGSYRGGPIDASGVNSFKFED